MVRANTLVYELILVLLLNTKILRVKDYYDAPVTDKETKTEFSNSSIITLLVK